MRPPRLWFLIALLPLATGCVPVIYSEQPLGESTVLDPKEWNGTWLFATPDALGKIAVVDAERGVITLSGTDLSCKFVPSEKPEVWQLRRVPGGKPLERVIWYFPTSFDLATREASPSDGRLYKYVVFWRGGRGVLDSYGVAADRIEALVRKGQLPGRVEGGKLIVGPLASEHYGLLLSDEQPLVDWQSHFSIQRLPPQLDPCEKSEKPAGGP